MTGFHVLVVDDDPDMIDTMRSLLERTVAVQVSSAQTLEEALDRLRSPEPLHLVICDLRLGPAEGVEFLRECRRVRPEVRRVLMTGFSQEGREETGVRPDDADWVLEKDELFSSWEAFQVELRQLLQEA